MVSILLYAGGVRVSLLCRDCVLAMTCGVVIVLSVLHSCLFIQKWYNSAFNNLKHCAGFLASIKRKTNWIEYTFFWNFAAFFVNMFVCFYMILQAYHYDITICMLLIHGSMCTCCAHAGTIIIGQNSSPAGSWCSRNDSRVKLFLNLAGVCRSLEEKERSRSLEEKEKSNDYYMIYPTDDRHRHTGLSHQNM